MKQKGKWKGEDVSSRPTGEGRRSGWGEGAARGLRSRLCFSICFSTKSLDFVFSMRCNWHNIMLVSGIQHNASIFVYVVKWLPAREILGLRQVCLWGEKKDETGARISGEGVHGCSYLSFPVFVLSWCHFPWVPWVYRMYNFRCLCSLIWRLFLRTQASSKSQH